MRENPPEDGVPQNALAMASSLMYGLFVLIAVLWFLFIAANRFVTMANHHFGRSAA